MRVFPLERRMKIASRATSRPQASGSNIWARLSSVRGFLCGGLVRDCEEQSEGLKASCIMHHRNALGRL